MSKKTKIIVFHMKELIYTLIFIGLAIVLILLMIIMFGPGQKKEETIASAYRAGVYTSAVEVQGRSIGVQVAVDTDHINSVSFVNLDETVATMYPLMEISMDNINRQIIETQSVEQVSCPKESQYTTRMLLSAVSRALDKATIQKEESEEEAGGELTLIDLVE